ncbi:MAG: hypothetical protein Q9222_003675, partial [Ikaeria aurantiellina]
MRLQVIVQRHGLPPVRILWTVGTISPPYAAAGPEPTISQLLDQINDIIPLESEDWGLEDYTVEVGGFECLHFAQTSQVLKEDDEVCIRPLSTSDLRFRKISGRHQISADGKHLFDGIAFGRPFLRRAERPVIRIPPRKRRRLAFDQDDEAEDYNTQRQVVIHAGFDGEDNSSAQSDYSEDRIPTPDDEEDLNAELDDIRNDASTTNRGSDLDSSSIQNLNLTTNTQSKRLNTIGRRRPLRAKGLGLRAPGLMVEGTDDLDHNGHENTTVTITSNDELAHEPRTSARTKRKEITPISSSKSVRFEDGEHATPATIRLPSSEDSEDDDFEPQDGETDESDKENATPGSHLKNYIQKSASISESRSSSETDSEVDETSYSGSSGSASSSSESDDEIDRWAKNAGKGSHSEISSDETSSSSGSSSDSEENSTQKQQHKSSPAARSSITERKVQGSRSGHQIEQGIPPKPTPPGLGKRSTQKRNQRKKDRRKLIRLQRAGILPASANTVVMRTMNAGAMESTEKDAPVSEEACPDALEHEKTAPKESKADDLKARRQALLEAIASRGIDAEADLEPTGPPIVTKTNGGSNDRAAAVAESTLDPSEKTLMDTNPGAKTGGESTIAADDRQAEPLELQSNGQKPRFRLDMDSSRRLVFGALGQRTPKTKEEEIIVQAKLMQQAQASQKPPAERASIVEPDIIPSPLEESINWQDKIQLAAVECCHDGIELSTPPFPFVQRWDPQQQRGYGGRKTSLTQSNKKRKRNKYYEASFKPLEDDRPPKRQQQIANGTKTRFEDDDTLPAPEPPFNTSHHAVDDNSIAADEQLLRETEEASNGITEEPGVKEALPGLPEDVSLCQNLEQAACVAGAIISFKQLDMSSATSWQPRISAYRTALIDNVLDDGTLSMRMALRDKPQGEKRYDPETGERLYSKFEMPGYNEDEIEDDGGTLDLGFADLIEPKLVRAAEVDSETSITVGNGDGIPDLDEMEVSKVGDPSTTASDVVHQSTEESRSLDTVSEQVRKEIHDLIKDAGWRSSVRSNDSTRLDVKDLSQAEQDDVTTDYSRDPQSTGPVSPKFNGFSSSPPAEEFEEVEEEQVIYPTLRNLSSPPSKANGVSDPATADWTSQTDREAIQSISADFEKEMHQQLPPSYQVDQQSPHPAPQSASSSSSAAFDEPDRQPSSFPPLPTPLTNSLNSTIPDSQPPPPPTHPDHPEPTIATSSSDDDLPSIETVFSSFSSSQRRATPSNNNDVIKSEHHSSSSSDADDLRTLPMHSKNNNNIDSLPVSSAPARLTGSRTPKIKARANKRSRLNRYEPAPRSSQDWIGTQVVDLT